MNTPVYNSEFGNKLRDFDKTKKEKERIYGDTKRRAKESKIDVGDHVVVRNLRKRNKLETNFNPQPHVVVKKSGTRITLKNLSTGVEFDRHINHAKLLISCNPVNTRSTILDEVITSSTKTRIANELKEAPTNGPLEKRSQRSKRKPEYLKNYEVYKIIKRD